VSRQTASNFKQQQPTVHLLDFATRSSSSFFLIAYELDEPYNTPDNTHCWVQFDSLINSISHANNVPAEKRSMMTMKTATRSHPEIVGDMLHVTLNFDISKIPFVHF